MSVRAMTWAWEQDGTTPSHPRPITPVQKLVLMRLGDHANDEGICWPGKDHLAARCCCSKRTIDAAIAELVKRGLIRVKRRKNEDGTDAPNVYILSIRQGDLFASAGQGANSAPYRAAAAPSKCEDQALSDEGRVQILQGEGAAAAPEPSLEPSTTTSAQERDLSEWQPRAAVIERVRMLHPKITDEFVEQERLEFITFAETNFSDRQLDSRFQSHLVRQWVRQGNKPAGLPRNTDDLVARMGELGGPKPRPQESPQQYRERCRQWQNEGRPQLDKQPPPAERPWWRDLNNGMLREADRLGIVTSGSVDHVQLLVEIIQALEDREEPVPPGARALLNRVAA